jgi:hypothetical protein
VLAGGVDSGFQEGLVKDGEVDKKVTVFIDTLLWM